VSETDFGFGRRIVVRGVTGSGKSTFARALGDALGLTPIELDHIHWQLPDWQEPATKEFQRDVRAALDAAPGGWVVDGNYSAATAVVLERADTLIWINLPFRVSFFRVVSRTLRRWRGKELLWGVQRERLREQFLSKHSLFLWAITHHRATARRVRQIVRDNSHLLFYELRSPREVAALLEAAKWQGVRN
jgi:adenylate kinase family enzyme